MSTIQQWKKLAINGGTPVRSEKPVERRFFGEQARQAIEAVLNSGNLLEWYGGPMVREFERSFSTLHNREHAVLMSSGTAALHASYFAVGIQPGDEVIIPSLGFVTDASTAVQLGGIPVYVDIDPQTWVIAPEDVAAKITEKTKAILAIHMFGQPADMPTLMATARRHGLLVIEDCGQAHGAKIAGKLVGTFADIASYSLASRKHVTTGGQGGINLLDNLEWADKMRAFIHYGKVGRYEFVTPAQNYQITELQAAIGLVSLQQLEQEITRYRENESRLRQLIRHSELEMDTEVPGTFHSRFKAAFLLPRKYGQLRNWFSEALGLEGVPNMYYPLLADIEWLSRYPHRSEGCLNARDICSRLITIPTAVEQAMIPDIAEAILKVYECLDIAAKQVG